MSSLAIIGLFGIFVAVFAASLAIAGYASERRRALHMLEASVASTGGTNLRDEALTPSFATRFFTPIAAAVKPLVERFSRSDAREKITWKIVQAGNPAGWDTEKVLLARAIGTILLPIVTFFLLSGSSAAVRLFAVAIAAYMGYAAPTTILDGRIAKRQKAIQRALPDSLDLLTISVEAGLGFDAALKQVVKEVPGPLSHEIARTLREIQLGVPRAEAFRNLKDRTSVEELKGFTLAIVQADAFGISIANVLRAQADTIRLKRKQRTEEQAMKIPVKILFPLIFCVLPALFVVVLGPGVIRMAQDFFGL